VKVLLTGAFGNIGPNVVEKLLEQRHEVMCFDRKTEATEKKAERFTGQVEALWGDLRNADDVAAAVHDRDVVIHIAFALPPMSEYRPEKSREINVGGTQNILNSMKSLSPPPKIILASSSSVFSINPKNTSQRTASDPVEPTDHYTKHKLECEQLVQESGLDWAVFRFGFVPPVAFGLHSSIFHIPLDTQMQFLHPQDIGLAITNAISCNETWGKISLIGSGQGSQIYYRDFIDSFMGAMGIGKLPDEAFGTKPYYTVWMDTSESQRLLQYQRHSFKDFAREMPSLVGYRRYWVRLFRPFYRRRLLKKSPYLMASR
jgi:UDP-glucose 4-epimerase